MIDPAKSRAAALSLFDASVQNVRELIADPKTCNNDHPRLREYISDMGVYARRVVNINASIKDLEELNKA